MEKHEAKAFREKMDFIAGAVRPTEKMALLAEELDELADAAIIFRNSIQEKRSRKGRRYTMSKEDRDEMIAEMADVMAVLICTIHPDDMRIALEYAEMHRGETKIRTGTDLKRELNQMIAICRIFREMAFKHRRCGSKDNPTAVPKEHIDGIIGVCIPLLLGYMMDLHDEELEAKSERMLKEKIDRWYDRLMMLQGSDVNEQE